MKIWKREQQTIFINFLYTLTSNMRITLWYIQNHKIKWKINRVTKISLISKDLLIFC